MQKTTRKMRKPVPVRELTKADIEKGQFSGNLKQDCDALRAVLSASADLKERTIKMSDGAPCAVLYFANLTNLALISESIIEPLQRHGGAQGILHIAEQVVHVPEYKAGRLIWRGSWLFTGLSHHDDRRSLGPRGHRELPISHSRSHTSCAAGVLSGGGRDVHVSAMGSRFLC